MESIRLIVPCRPICVVDSPLCNRLQSSRTPLHSWDMILMCWNCDHSSHSIVWCSLHCLLLVQAQRVFSWPPQQPQPPFGFLLPCWCPVCWLDSFYLGHSHDIQWSNNRPLWLLSYRLSCGRLCTHASLGLLVFLPHPATFLKQPYLSSRCQSSSDDCRNPVLILWTLLGPPVSCSQVLTLGQSRYTGHLSLKVSSEIPCSSQTGSLPLQWNLLRESLCTSSYVLASQLSDRYLNSRKCSYIFCTCVCHFSCHTLHMVVGSQKLVPCPLSVDSFSLLPALKRITVYLRAHKLISWVGISLAWCFQSWFSTSVSLKRCKTLLPAIRSAVDLKKGGK